MDWPISFLHRTSTQVVGVQEDYWLPHTCCAGLLGVVVVIVVFGEKKLGKNIFWSKKIPVQKT